jgi:hypothetical protein
MPGYQGTLFETIINVLSELSEDELIELRNRIDFLLEGPAQVKTLDNQPKDNEPIDDGAITDMKQGTQIIYVPLHALGDLTHPNCMRGFVISPPPMGRIAIVRYWEPGAVGVTLRTGPQGQATDSDRLVAVDSCAQEIVDKLLAEAS